MECRNCELRQRQFFCKTCIKTHLRDAQSQHAHFSTDLSAVVSSASAALTNIVQPARTARAGVAEVRSRIDELTAGLSGIRRECDKKRDRVRKLREDLAQRRRTLGAARLLLKSTSPATPNRPTTPAAVPPTPSSAPFLATPLAEASGGIHAFPQFAAPDTPHLPPSPAYLALTQALARARSGLVQELVDVFNIVEVGGRPPVGGKAGTKGEWTIGGLVLPVPGDIRRYPPDHINAVLTLTIHFLSLLSFYLGVKLPFEVTWTGGKLGLGQPWIGAIRGGSAGGGDGGWGRWHKKHPLHLTGQPTSQTADSSETRAASSAASGSSDDEDPMASSVLTVKAKTKPTLAPITTMMQPTRTSSRPGPSPLSAPTPRRATTLSLTSALTSVGGAMRKGVGGVVSAGAGVVGYASSPRSRTVSNALEESAFMVAPSSSSSPPSRRPSTRRKETAPNTPVHLSPSTASPSFTTGYTMLIYNVCYLAHTQRVTPEIGLSQAGEVLSNLWRCCCSPELGRVGHESVGWVVSPSTAAGSYGQIAPTSPGHEGTDGGALTLVRLPPPTPPTFAMDFGQLLQAVSGAGGAGARRAKTRVIPAGDSKVRRVYSETREDVDDIEGWGYENVGASVMRPVREEPSGVGLKDDWDLVDEDVGF